MPSLETIMRKHKVKLLILTSIIFYSFFTQANTTNLIDAIKNQTVDNERIVTAIRNQTVDIFAEDHLGNTPLHWAYHTDNKKVIRALLEAGAEKDVKNSKGKLPNELSPHVQEQQLHIIEPKEIPTSQKNLTTDNSSTYLIDAVKADNLEEVLRHLAFSKTEQEQLDRALFIAVDKENVNQKILLALLIKGANPNVSSGYLSVLLNAVKRHDTQSVSNLLSTGRVNVDKPIGTQHPITALYTATKSNDIDIINLLLDAGADPENNKTYEGRKPFISAILNDSAEAIILLLDAGADPHRKTPRGKTALDVAIKTMHLNLAFRLTNAGMYAHTGFSFIRAMSAALQNTNEAVRNENIETISKIFNVIHREKLSSEQYAMSETTNTLERIVSLYAKFYNRRKDNTILNIAYGNQNVFRILLENVSADIDNLWWELMTRPHRKDKTDLTLNMIEAMLSTKKLSGVNTQDTEGNTALHRMLRGASFDTLPALEMLLQNGANPNIENNRGLKSLNLVTNADLRSILVRYGAVPHDWSVFWSREVLQGTLDNSYRISSMLFLFEQAGTINARDSSGRTILHEFIMGQYDINYMISQLIRKGADPTIKDNKGDTAFDLANRHNPTAKAILDRLTRDETSTAPSSCQRAHMN